MSVGDVIAGDGSWGGVGGDATLTVDGTDIISLIQLDLEANGGIANASANGGSGNSARFNATNATRLGGIDLLAGVGGLATARANGGAIIVGNLYAGGNVGTVVDFGNIVAGDACCGDHGESQVFHRFSGTLISAVQLALAANGGETNSVADGGDDNEVTLRADGTTTIGTLRAGNGGTTVTDANGGLITVGNVTSGYNRGAVFEGPPPSGGGADHPDDGKPKPGGDHPDGGKPGGQPGGGKPSSGGGKSSGGGGGKAGKVKELPSTGDGSTAVAGQDAGNAALLLFGTVVVLAGAGYGLRRRTTA
jgi:hypothetical protein